MPTEEGQDRAFTPALGRGPTRLYDAALRVFTRERRWRGAVMDAVAAANPRTVLDVGCGTGTLAIGMASRIPGALVTGLDPDTEALAIAARKTAGVRQSIAWRIGFASDAALDGRASAFDVVTCTLVLHQVPLAGKAVGLSAMQAALRPGGRLVLADYSEQRLPLMRALFRLTVQRIDGREDTQPNADGVLPRLIAGAGFADVAESMVIPTPSGSISILTATKVG
ncbi:MAG: class I SAM-dependent methyltransferase [Sphingomonas sp.]|uniref:class I SAM-dependent methyltransferase n=1 Tax=Sphingomonas sp. TaxID=28214 RepID=UPI001AD05A8C|nr:class I SAM-dependent methyltransferase [Sphingomonas sp.]MBN8809137.1 class I SAM-dependent methyltransferase [Sphingomonas sp.]